MRYTTARFGEVANLFGEFAQGRPLSAVSGVNIELYQPSAGGAAVALTVSGCTEISGSRAGGFATYYWPTSGITTQPTTQVEYLYVMRDTQTSRVQKGKLVLGGHPDSSAIDSYRDAVWIDVDGGGTPGTTFPTGTPRQPVDNLADALTIRASFGLPKTLHIHGQLTVSGQDLSEYTLLGVDPDVDGVTFDPGSVTSGMSLQSLGIYGYLNGRITADRCVLGEEFGLVSGLNGLLNRCGSAGTLRLAPGAVVNGLEFAGRSIFGTTIDFVEAGGSSFLAGEAVGILAAANMTAAGDIFALAGLGINVTLQSSCTAGIARLAGVGELSNSSAGTTVIDNLLRGTRVDIAVSSRMAAGALVGLSGATISGIADQVWDEPLADHLAAGSTGAALAAASGNIAPTAAAVADAVWDEPIVDHVASGSTGANLYDSRRHITNRRRIVSGVAPWLERTYADDGVTPIQEAELRDLAGADITDSNRPSGTLIAERDPV